MRQKSLLKFSLLSLLMTWIGGGGAGAQSYLSWTYTSNVTLSTDGSNASNCQVEVNSTRYEGIKVGTSSKGGSYTVDVPAGTKYLHLHVAAWKGVTGLSLNISGATTTPTSISLTADEGVSNNTPFTFSGTASSSDFYKVVTLSTVPEVTTTLTFTTSISKRFVVFGVNAEILPTSISLDKTSMTKTVGEDDETLTATVLPSTAYNKTVTWETSNSAVATVSNGIVSFVGEGTADITAKTYNNLTATCAVTVQATSSPNVVLSESNLSFGEIEIGNTKELTFTVTPSNLTGNLTVSCDNDKYTVSPTSIAQDATTAQTITVTAAPTALDDDMDATVTISGGGITSKEVTLSASVYQVAQVTLNATNGSIEKDGEETTGFEGRLNATAMLTAVADDGYIFESWSATGATPATSTSAEQEFTFTGTDVTITANFVVNPYVTVSLTGTDMSNMSDAGTGYGTEKSVTVNGLVWSTNGYQEAKTTDMIQLRARTNDSGVSWIKLPQVPGTIQNIQFDVTNANGGSLDTGSATPTVLNFQTENTENGTIIAKSEDTSSKSKTIDLSDKNYSTGYITAGAGIRVWSIKLTYLPYPASIEAEVGSTGYATFVPEYSVEVPNTVAAYYATAASAETVTLSDVLAIPAGTPVILKGTGTHTFDVTDMTDSEVAEINDNLTASANLLAISDGTKGVNDYVLYNGAEGAGFYKWTGAALAAGRVYLPAASVPAEAAALKIVFADETTAIATVEQATAADSPCYNLSGQRVGKTAKGLYIKDGRKYIVK